MAHLLTPRDAEIRHFHMYCGVGGGALGFNRGQARVGRARAHMRCIGGIDVDPGAIESFTRLVGVPGTVLDLFDRQQFEDFHGHEPREDWREATADDIRIAAHGERPHIIFLSAPCKGFSGLLSGKNARSRKYRALNRCTLRGVRLVLEAWGDDPPELILFENVPRIQTRGRAFLDEITDLLDAAGYAVAETTHNCGELGGLGQNRQRFLLVARHREKVGPFLYEPPKRPLRTIGEVIGDLPLPGGDDAGLHRLPRLQWKTWVRLALIEAGSDWRSLEKLEVEDGYLKDLVLVPEYFRGSYGVQRWDDVSSTVTGRAGPSTGRFSVADPRPPRDLGRYEPYGVVDWEDQSRTVTSQAAPGSGPYSVADPRLDCNASDRRKRRFNNVLRVVRWDNASRCVTGAGGAKQAIADPRVGLANGTGYRNGFYGVRRTDAVSGTVTGSARHDNGPWSVADKRLPAPSEQCRPLIVSLDDTWHRPLTTLELAALQSFPADLVLASGSDSECRGWIGNSVPPDSAAAIASEMAETLLLAWAGQTFQLSAKPIWVLPISIALSVATPEEVHRG